MRKVLLILLVALCVLCFFGCNTKPTPTEPPTEAPTVAPTVAPTEPPVTEPEPTEPEPTEPPVPVNPLTGEELEEAYTGRPVMFTINKAKCFD